MPDAPLGPFELVDAGPACVRVRCTHALKAFALLEALGFSRRSGQGVLVDGRLLVDGAPVPADAHLEAGVEATMVFGAPAVAHQVAHDVEPAHIVWHDRLALAAEKPAPLLVHGDGTGAPTLTERTRCAVATIAGREGWPFVPDVQALMRLDVDTTGLVLFSLTPEFQPAFDALVAGHGIEKRYLAVVEGLRRRWPQEISLPVARDRHDARRMRVGRGGKEALTRVAVVAEGKGVTLLALRLMTGRRHQIRVHLAHLGHPILGDALYGHGRGPLMLHASSLAFVHPLTAESIRIATDWPRRFTKHFAPQPVDWSIL